MRKSALLFTSAILAAGCSGTAVAEPYPNSFADYLNARGLYFNYLAAAEESFWFRTSSGDIVLRLPRAVAPKVSVVSAEGQPPDADVAHVRSEVELAMSSALDRLGIRRCSTGAADDQTQCIPFAVQIGFAVTHYDVVYLPDLRSSSGRHMGSMAMKRFGSDDRVYGMACSTIAETSTVGNVTHLDVAFTVEDVTSDALMPATTSASFPDFGPPELVLPRQMTPLTFGMERCLLGLLGVSVVPDLPKVDIGYYVAQSLETLHAAETYLTQDQTAGDVPELVMTHALRKALGKEPVVGSE